MNEAMKKTKTLTLLQAKNLKRGTIVYTPRWKNADGTDQRWKVNGKVKTWKRNPERVQVPIKRGLYDYAYITENELSEFTLYDTSGK